MLNLCLCVDLILTIYDPFSPAYRRMKWYYLFSVTATLTLVLIQSFFDKALDYDHEEEENYDCISKNPSTHFVQLQKRANLVLAIALSLYIVVAIYSIVYSYRRLHRPGVSGAVRNLFLKKHFLYVVVFIVVWMI